MRATSGTAAEESVVDEVRVVYTCPSASTRQKARAHSTVPIQSRHAHPIASRNENPLHSVAPNRLTP